MSKVDDYLEALKQHPPKPPEADLGVFGRVRITVYGHVRLETEGKDGRTIERSIDRGEVPALVAFLADAYDLRIPTPHALKMAIVDAREGARNMYVSRKLGDSKDCAYWDGKLTAYSSVLEQFFPDEFPKNFPENLEAQKP